MNHPILQFGTGRFLQAHVDLFVAEALRQGRALGRITVVQSTGSAQSSARAAVLAQGYRVEVRGMQQGQPLEASVSVDSIQAVWHADRDWALLREAVAHSVQVIVSNTADAGYVLDASDQATLLRQPAQTPRSYPAKLLVLLHQRWQQRPQAPLTLYPCELVSRNGDTLRAIVSTLALEWDAAPAFLHYLQSHCVWVNSLVDRIVSSPLEPAGAVAEPYALWALERQPRMVLPCTHPAIVVTDQLADYEQRKLWLLNLGHTVLAEHWQYLGSPADMTVVQAMQTPVLRTPLEAVWADEVLPVFDAEGTGDAARHYLDELRDRLLNPFLEHRLADIAKNHGEKKQRRLAPVVQRAEALQLSIAQAQLRNALSKR
ncbi:D-mannonate oxidoreductase [Rhodoferax saidenbachensis]|uniref:D-mannonate oxidoreductase n=1 Tax=Rhodoferax saidenbachensis TaxID=1484693 RepID=A0A1P8KCM6_9BURK|nr:D-mannonate oxidoreductase [Rhodoferax saidenbachensis]APW43780.1 D-mannonate oxidoreductase [Rhodoferax saidenbachensis]